MEFIDGGSIFELLKPGPINEEKLLVLSCMKYY